MPQAAVRPPARPPARLTIDRGHCWLPGVQGQDGGGPDGGRAGAVVQRPRHTDALPAVNAQLIRGRGAGQQHLYRCRGPGLQEEGAAGAAGRAGWLANGMQQLGGLEGLAGLGAGASSSPDLRLLPVLDQRRAYTFQGRTCMQCDKSGSFVPCPGSRRASLIELGPP